MKIAGLDLSLTSTGVAILSDGTCTTLAIESSAPKRVRGDKTAVPIRQRRERIATIVDEVADAVFPLVDLALVEAPSYGSQGAGTWDRAWLWGGVIERLLGNDVPVAIVPPAVRAKWATGSGASGKAQVAVNLSRMWPGVDPGISDDEWDALALVSMGAQHLGVLPIELARHADQLTKVQWPLFPAGVAAAS